MDSFNLTPVGHRILVKVLPVEKVTSGGILIPGREGQARISEDVEVIAIGRQAFKAFDDGEPWCKVGDKVKAVKGSGVNISSLENNDTYRVINDEDIFAIINEG